MIKNKTIAIIGFGKEGMATANYLSDLNSISIIDSKKEREFTGSDFNKIKNIKKIKFYFDNDLPDEKNFDFIIRSPGVRPDNSIIKKIKSSNTVLSSPTALFFENCPCPIIGVTGTKGKGTTSTLIYEMIKSQKKNVFLAGNIGTPALEILNQLSKDSSVILELSSFQLMNLKYSPHIAVVLMIVPEHLNWHTSYHEYEKAKKTIVAYQKNTDYVVVNADYMSSVSLLTNTKSRIFYFSTAHKSNGTYLEKDLIFSEINKKEEICRVDDIFIPGKHNIQNVLAAVAVAKIEGIENKNIQKVLKTFHGLPHRLQLVRIYRGVKFYNDSFSTTPETTIAAIKSFNNPKILILGGSSKNSDFSELGETINKDKTIKAIILIGEESEKIKKTCSGFRGKIIFNKNNMKGIITSACELAQNGDIVLLSPACASFDMFKNYIDRGDKFTEAVNALK